MFLILFLFFSMRLLGSFFRLKGKWFNYVVTFFFEKEKNLGRSDDTKRRKKRGWPSNHIRGRG